MSLGDECPVVSGVSPKEGFPGTKITIRGENLGVRKDDILSVYICGTSCIQSLEYISSKKLVCYTPNVVGPGEIIVNTYSGGKGRCTVTFTGLEPEPVPMLGPLEESAVWMEEDFNSLARVFSDKTESPVYTRDLTNPLGRDPGAKKHRGGSENLGDLFPNESGNLTDANFNPVRHLLEKHRYTSFYNLKLGLSQLKREVERNDQAPVQFMRDNLDAFLQCYDTISDVNTLLIRNESESHGGSLTDRVEELLSESANRAKVVFDGILKSKARADTTRSVLTVLQRYKFLFGLPKNIEKNIKDHEYDLVATDYEKAKFLFSSTQVNIFKRVLQEVEKKIANFREDLKLQLLVLPSTLDQQKRLIKYLLELDCEGDPAWDCISNMNLWILRLLYTSKEDFQLIQSDRMTGELASLPGRSTPAAEPLPPTLPPRIRTGGHSRNTSDVSYMSSSSYGSTVVTSPVHTESPEGINRITGAGGMPQLKGSEWRLRRGDNSGPPSRILFVDELTEIFCSMLPDLWKLGQAYLNGSLFQGVALLSENQKKLAEKCDSNKGKFESKVMEIIEIYVDMVNCALFPDAYESLSEEKMEKLGEWNSFEDDILETSGVWLPQTVRSIRACVNSLKGIGLPKKGTDLLSQLAMNVRLLCTETLFQRAAKDIKILHEREDWKVLNEEGGIVTSLPILLENRVVDVLLTLKEIVNEPHEDTSSEELRDMAKKHFAVLLEHFLACIDHLAFYSEEEQNIEAITSSNQRLDQTPTLTTSRDRRLLILMSNMHYLMTEVIPRVFTCFMSHGYPPCMDLQDQVIEDVTALDNKIFEVYIKQKRESLQGIIEQGMQVGYFDWNQATEPDQVRSYIKQIFMNLVLIHSEVYAVSALIVPRVMHQLVKILSREFYTCISEVEAFNVNGVIHAFIELATLQDILEPYLDDESKRSFYMSRKHLGEWDIEGNSKISEIIDDFKEKTHFQLKCFKRDYSRKNEV